MLLMGKFCNNKESAASMFTRFAYFLSRPFSCSGTWRQNVPKKTRIVLVGATSAPCFSYMRGVQRRAKKKYYFCRLYTAPILLAQRCLCCFIYFSRSHLLSVLQWLEICKIKIQYEGYNKVIVPSSRSQADTISDLPRFYLYATFKAVANQPFLPMYTAMSAIIYRCGEDRII